MTLDPHLGPLLEGAGRILIFTGAGISTGSGIPDYLGPQGVWKRRQPVYSQDFVGDLERRVFKFQGGGIVCLDRDEAGWHIRWTLMPRIGWVGGGAKQDLPGPPIEAMPDCTAGPSRRETLGGVAGSRGLGSGTTTFAAASPAVSGRPM